jgi:DNA-binding NarL/FixJ family response regulator
LGKGERIRIGVVAADPLRSVGLVAILEDNLDVEALPLNLEQAFEVEPMVAVLLDSRASLDAVIDIVGRLRRVRPGLKIIVMSEPMDPEHVQAVIGSGAKGYLSDNSSESEIRMAMEVVLDGSIWAPRKVLARLIDAGSANAAQAGTAAAAANVAVEASMTPREREVLHLLMDGRSNRDIAGAMGIDEVTVKAHLGRMLRKTRSANRVELTLRAMEERTPKHQL